MYSTNLTKIHTKQNKCICSIFFTSRKESACNYSKLLGILRFDNIVTLGLATFANRLSNNLSNVPEIFRDYLTPISNIHNHNTRLSARNNFYQPNIITNYRKFTTKFTISKLWNSVPIHLKQLSTKAFKIKFKNFLLSCQL
jgi:hypothetical protein